MSASTGNSTGGSESSAAVAQIDFLKQIEGNLFTDQEMAEIVQRLIVKMTGLSDSGVHVGPTPPSRKDLGWLPTDSNGVPIGSIRHYDTTTGQWVSDLDGISTPDRFNGSDLSGKAGNLATFIGSGDDKGLFVAAPGLRAGVYYEADIPAADFGTDLEYGIADPFDETDDYAVVVIPKADYFADDFRWWMTSKAVDGFVIHVQGTAANFVFDLAALPV